MQTAYFTVQTFLLMLDFARLAVTVVLVYNPSILGITLCAFGGGCASITPWNAALLA